MRMGSLFFRWSFATDAQSLAQGAVPPTVPLPGGLSVCFDSQLMGEEQWQHMWFPPPLCHVQKSLL